MKEDLKQEIIVLTGFKGLSNRFKLITVGIAVILTVLALVAIKHQSHLLTQSESRYALKTAEIASLENIKENDRKLISELKESLTRSEEAEKLLDERLDSLKLAFTKFEDDENDIQTFVANLDSSSRIVELQRIRSICCN